MERPLNTTQKEMLALERFFPHYMREHAEQVLFALSILFLSLSVLLNIFIETRFGRLWPIAEGLFLVTFALLLKTILIELYFHTLRRELESNHEISFATLLVIGLHHPKKKDLAKAFLHSHLGRQVVDKLGISREEIAHFLRIKESVPMEVPQKGHLHELAGYIHDEDPYFRDFLTRVHVSKELLMQSSEAVEHKHHRALSSRTLLHPLFSRADTKVFSMDHVVRNEIEELERFYRIIITEQSTQLIVSYFREDIVHNASEDNRVAFLTELIEWSLRSNRESFHGASVILPADVRLFLIHKKAVV